MSDNDERERNKRAAAERAVEFVESDMIVGLGVGSTTIYAVRRIGDLIASGTLHNILGIPCATQVATEAGRFGIPLTTLDDHPHVDVTIDGADEVDPHLNLIKGGGGALLREKMVAQASKREIIVVDGAKLSPQLGTTWALPVEVVEFGWRATAAWIRDQGAEVTLRQRTDGTPVRTDQGNLVLDCRFGPISDPYSLAELLDRRAGVVEHGLFLDLATDLVVADANGIRHQQSGLQRYSNSQKG
jgi:ribose 5-phosphate isomerase A